MSIKSNVSGNKVEFSSSFLFPKKIINANKNKIINRAHGLCKACDLLYKLNQFPLKYFSPIIEKTRMLSNFAISTLLNDMKFVV